LVELMNAISVGLILTSVFALRFGYWNRPLVLGAYFALFFVAEWVAGHYFFPPGAIGIEITYVCWALIPPVLVAIYLLRRYEQSQQGAEGDSDPS
jgi:hypothetical protein